MLIKCFFKYCNILHITQLHHFQKPNYDFLNTNYDFLNTFLTSNYDFLNTFLNKNDIVFCNVVFKHYVCTRYF